MLELNLTYQGQSISGFPLLLDLDRQTRMTLMLTLKKTEEDIVFFQRKLESVDDSVDARTAASRRNLQRVCVECSQREVTALVLPCRHFRYCAACASGNSVLNTACKVPRCGVITTGFIVTTSADEK